MSTDPHDRAELPLPSHRHRFWVDENPDPLPCLYDEEGYPVIAFAPVPQLRRRRVGWDADRQRAFIALLARVPSVTRAAKAVGMSARSAYRLLDKPGAQEFARAWDQALRFGMDRLKGRSLARCLEGGDFVPVYRKGRLVRIEWRENDALAIALLSARNRDIDSYRRGAQVRWRQKREWAKCDEERAAKEREAAEAREANARALEQALARPRGIPRVRFL